MSSPAPKQAESEFDDLLGQLVDELAMTPASESAVALVPDPPPAEARVDSTHHLAAEAAAAAAAAAAAKPQPSQTNNLVKVVGIIAGSLTVVAVAALAMFASQEPSASVDDGQALAADLDHERLAQIAATEQAAVERAEADRIAAERAEITARAVRIEAGLLDDEARAKAEAEASKPKRRVRRRSSSSKPKKPKTKPRDSFEDL